VALPPSPLAVYIHWPFCLSMCPYCDFNSHVRQDVDQARWRAALLAELAHDSGELAGRTITSIFFGGGTPSLMDPALVGAIIDAVAGHWPMAEDLEITLEANPTSVEAGRLADFRSAGVNRVSLGVQALDDGALAFLGRGHSANQAIAAVAVARTLFDRVSFDLIYGRPGQTLAAWRAELAQALRLAGDHLSLYQLTIEKGTPFHAAVRDGQFSLPGEELAADLFEQTQAMMEDAELPAYEISNHARPGAACRHNLTTWRGDDYLGIGPGAHGRLTGDGGTRATERYPAPEAWLKAVEKGGHGMRRAETIPPDDRVQELVMMGLRLTAGMDRKEFERRTGVALEDVIDAAALTRLTDGGFIELTAVSLRATRAGRLRLNAVIAALLV